MVLQDEEMDLARYKTASAELDSPSRDEGLWIKAFAESGGVENASRAMYIKLRVEQLRRSAVADAARRVVGDSVASSMVGGSAAGVSQTPFHAPSPPPIAPKGPARVAQTLYDIVGVSRGADSATIAAAIQAKNSQPDDAIGTPEERQRREILLKNASEVLLNDDKRRSYDDRVFKVDTVAPASAKNVEPPRPVYVTPPVSGMTEEEGVEDVPSTGKRWSAYVGWFVVWVCILGVLSAPLTKVPLGAILGGVVAFCNIAILLYGILLIRQKFKLAPSEGARKNWIILGLSILVLLGLRLSIGGGRQLDAARADSNARAATAFAEQERLTATAEQAAAERTRPTTAAPSAYLLSMQAEHKELLEKLNGPRGSSLDDESRRSGMLGRIQVLEQAIASQTAAEAGIRPTTQASVQTLPKPFAITSCDATGCWDNMSNRYTKGAGDTYFGPKGACQVSGGMMRCP